MLERWATASDGEKTGDGTEVGLFIPLPRDLAAQFPSLGGEDKSPPHVTFLYVGDCPETRIPLFLRICRATLARFDRPVRAKIEPLDYFEHPDKGRRVAITPIRFDRDMGQLKELLRENLVDSGFEIKDGFPIYRPHTTLAYLDGLDSKYEGEVPKGAWMCKDVEVWGLPKAYRISFQRKLDKQASKYTKKIDNGDEKPIYQYSEGHVKKRNEEKANRMDQLGATRGKLSEKMRKDFSSEDPKTKRQALAVACIDRTYERVGNPTSAEVGRFGVTVWKKKHLTFSGNSASLKYVGKSGVKQNKKITDPKIIAGLKELVKDKSPGDFIFSWETKEGPPKNLSARDVNNYLQDFEITAKDLRGYHANREMVTLLKKKRKGKLPADSKEKEKLLKREFKEALEETAEAVGHEPSTLRNQYLVPGLEDQYTGEGKVLKSFGKGQKKKATKSVTEKEDEKIREVVKKHPNFKPSRKDLKKRRVDGEDSDLEKEDRDLSLNYKKVAKKSQSFPYNSDILFRNTWERFTGGGYVPYIKIANRPDGSYLDLNGEGSVGPFKKYSSALRVITQHVGSDPSTVILGEKFSVGPNKSPDSLTKSSHCIMDLDGDVVVEGDNPINLLANYHEDFFKRANRGGELPVRSFQEVTKALDKVASLFETHHQYLGINGKVAKDFALRCDILSDLLEKKASEGSHMEHFSEALEKETDEPYMKYFEDTTGPLQQDSDESFMKGQFTDRDTHELRDIEKRASFWEAVDAGPNSRETREFRKLAMMSTLPQTSSEKYWDRPSGALVSDTDEPYMRGHFTEQEWDELQKMEGGHGGKEFDQEMVNGEFQVDWK